MGDILGALGAFCVRFRWAVVAVWIILAVGLTLLTNALGPTTDNTVTMPGTDSQAATDLLTAEFPPQQNGTSPAVYRVAEGKVDDGGPHQKAITAAYKAVKAQKGVYSVTSPFENPQAGLISKDHKYAFMPILLSWDSQQLNPDRAERIFAAATDAPEEAGITAAVGGPIGSTLSQPDTAFSEKLGMVAAGIILALSFGSLIAMGMPLLSAVFGLLLGLAGIWLLGTFVDTPSIGVTIARMIGLGVGIDYALFLVNRHRGYVIGDGMDPKAAAARAVATSGGAIIFAGGTVVIALVSLQVAGIPFIAALGFACAVAVVGAVLAAITLLPAVLAIVGGGVNRLRLPLIGRRADHPVGQRWAAVVTRHPLLSVLVAVGLLVPVAAPVSTLVLGQEDLAVAPQDTTERQAFDLMSAGFGPGYNGPLLVAVSMDPPAQPSKKYNNQYSQAESLKASLDEAQATLPQQQQELEDQQAALEEQAAVLQSQAALLEAQAAALEVQEQILVGEAGQLRDQEAELKAEAAQLGSQGKALAEEGEAALAREVELGRELGRNLAAQELIERILSEPRDPAVIRLLEEELARAQREAAVLRAEIADLAEQLSPQGRAILAEEKRLALRLVVNGVLIRALQRAVARADDPVTRKALEKALADAEERRARLERRLEQNLADLSPADRRIIRKIRPLARQLAKNTVLRRVLTRRLEAARSPVVTAALDKELAQLKQREPALRSELAANTAQLEELAREGEELQQRAVALARQGAALVRAAAQLAEEGEQLAAEAADLEAQKAALEAQQAQLEAQAAALQEWAAELQAEADEAQAEQAQAEKLQSELTAELTAAGGDPRGTDPRVVKLQTALATPDDVDLVSPPQINEAGTALTMSVIPDTRPADPVTDDLVLAERNDVIPGALSPGMAAHVGGTTAGNIDLAGLIAAKMLTVIVTVIALSSLLLLVAFRSLLIPVQAAIANLLAAGAAFGLVTVIFQWGWGLSAIGLDSPYGTVPVASYVPLMMFAALFGLSMDYQVFMMSTIQGEFAAGKSAQEAVRAGVAGASKIIVTAALIMMSVFGSFIFNDDPIVKQFGVGLTAAVGFAAFLVLVFAPAALMLFGGATWRLPGFLDRLLPDLDLEGRGLERRLAAQAAEAEPAAG